MAVRSGVSVGSAANQNKRMIKETASMQVASSIFTETSTQEHALGRILEIDDGLGRAFRYTKNGGTALAVGVTIQAPAPIANHQEHVGGAGTTGALGALDIVIGTTMTTALTANQYDRGWIHTNKVTGLGYTYEIEKHTNTATPTITIADVGGVRLAVDTTTEFTLTHNPYNGAIVSPTTLTAQIIGATTFPITASYYFWAQVKGPIALLVDTSETLVIGNSVGEPAAKAVAGAVGVNTATDGYLGRVMSVNVAAEYALIDLDIPY